MRVLSEIDEGGAVAYQEYSDTENPEDLVNLDLLNELEDSTNSDEVDPLVDLSDLIEEDPLSPEQENI